MADDLQIVNLIEHRQHNFDFSCEKKSRKFVYKKKKKKKKKDFKGFFPKLKKK